MASNEKIGVFDKNFHDFDDVYFLPELNYVGYGTVFLILFLIFYFVLQYNYIYSNWERLKCRNVFWAPLYFKNSKQAFEDCDTEQIDNVITKNIGDIKNRIYNLEKDYNYKNSEMLNMEDVSNISKESRLPLNNAINSMKNNITRISESINTILKSIIVSSTINEKLGTNEGQFLDMMKKSNLASS